MRWSMFWIWEIARDYQENILVVNQVYNMLIWKQNTLYNIIL